ncbi:MAG: hypothetical protein ACW98K_13115 [Candidatus Kariarchaeaceae archaeon]
MEETLLYPDTNTNKVAPPGLVFPRWNRVYYGISWFYHSFTTSFIVGLFLQEGFYDDVVVIFLFFWILINLGLLTSLIRLMKNFSLILNLPNYLFLHILIFPFYLYDFIGLSKPEGHYSSYKILNMVVLSSFLLLFLLLLHLHILFQREEVVEFYHFAEIIREQLPMKQFGIFTIISIIMFLQFWDLFFDF